MKPKSSPGTGIYLLLFSLLIGSGLLLYPAAGADQPTWMIILLLISAGCNLVALLI